MSQSYLNHIAENRRLCLLRLLKDGGSANESVLHTGLELLGFRREPRDRVRDDLRFLLNAGLITVEWFSDVQVCDITRRGVDAADGAITVEGVKKPSIGV